MTLLDELVRFYYDYDRFQGTKLTREKVTNTIGVLLDKARIVYYADFGRVFGYIESYRINYDQFGRIICGQKFDIGTQDIETGPICYLANVTVDPARRGGNTISVLLDRFFAQNRGAEYFVGQANRKKMGLVKVFKASAIHRHKKRFLEGVISNVEA